MIEPRIFAGARRVEELDVEELEPGTISRLLVHLIDDALGFPISVPVLVARGAKDGPVFGLTAALHGNELNGIPVLHRLFEGVDATRLRGTVVGVVVANVPGLHRGTREYVDGTDLNHIMPGLEDGKAAQVYAHRLVQRVVRHFDYLVDLHTASFGRVNSLYIRADMTHPDSARMAYLQKPQIIVHNPAADATLRGTAMAMQIPAITLEIGNPHRFQPGFIRRSVAGIRAVLGDLGLLRKRVLAEGPEPILCERSYWIYADIGGLLEVRPDVAQTVSAGDEIARLRNAFGDVLRVFTAPEDGIVIGKSVNPVGVSGARVLHLGVVARDIERFHPRSA
jgi:predicted deacylase